MRNYFLNLKNQKLINIQSLFDNQLFLEFENYTLAIYSEYSMNFNNLEELKQKVVTDTEQNSNLFSLIFKNIYKLQICLKPKKNIAEIMVLHDLKKQIFIVWEND